VTIEYKLTPSYICLRNNITKIVLLPNVGHTFMFMKEFEVAMNFGETSYKPLQLMRCGCTMCKTHLGVQPHRDLKFGLHANRLTLLYGESENHNSSIQSVIEVYEYLISFK
jgi:hypothetical protein